MVDGATYCSCPDGYVGDRCQDCDIRENLVACGTNGCVKKDDVCSKRVTCPFTPSQITKYCGDCAITNYCQNSGICTLDKSGFRACVCLFEFTGATCQTKIPNECTNKIPPLQPCPGNKCVSQDSICSRNTSCGYPDVQIKFNCEECFDQYCLNNGSCAKKGTQRSCTCTGQWIEDRCQTKLQISPTAYKFSGGPKNKSSIYIGVGVAAGILLIVVVLVVAYFIMKSRKKKGKGGAEIEIPEGVGNPVYDYFNEGKPLEDFRISDADTNMFATDDAFGIASDKGGATSMANPLYQNPFLKEDLTKYTTNNTNTGNKAFTVLS